MFYIFRKLCFYFREVAKFFNFFFGIFFNSYYACRFFFVTGLQKLIVFNISFFFRGRLAIIFYSPLEQFEINKNGAFFSGSSYNTDIELFYSKFWNFINFNSMQESIFFVIIFISFFSFCFFKTIKVYPYKWIQLFVEFFIINIRSFVIQNSGFGNQPMFMYFSFISISLLIFNLSGMLPFAFAMTSHFLSTFFYSFSLFFGINYIAINKHEKNFFNIFLPQGTPTWLLPLMVGLEFISYFSRLFSLSIRLFANIMAGHALLSIFTSFAFKAIQLGGFSLVVSIFGLFVLFAVISMEVAISLLQGFVFITLASLYVVDVHNVNHLL